MEKMNKIRKVPLEALIERLRELYDKGVDFVDISGRFESGQDTISFTFCREYMNEEYIEEFDTIEEEVKEQFPSKVEIKFTEEDLNQLL